MARGTKENPTLKQQRAIQLLYTEVTRPTGKSIVQILKDAGYAEESARQWTNIMAGLRPHLKPALDWMEIHRQKVMAKMDEHLEYATYDELRKSLASLTEAIQLLGGKPTANIAISAEVRHRIDELIED
ncbi:hypothetical protein Nham_0317 [Nitrobacter hamburgensis X14]|uniref:Uncharacterized protein n=1 Tax=Nitrobacter hamburgensis (strain DSM 10229 / NCIMB 13809 / X14) TaxID=323097 RepID=Q1QRD4_NITHX|nr:hypothetical protein [Nitrobacter hamburgensis]ABE61213.1 hypothetical protein Nham_0317 [Nitrobacter hamburgensis X14]